MRVDFMVGVEQRGKRLRMTDLHLIAVEPPVLAGAERLFERHSHHHRLHRGADGRQRDAVVGPEILDRLHFGIAREHAERHARHAGDALDAAVGLAPREQQIGDAGDRNVDRVGEDRLGHHAARGDDRPVHLHVLQAERRGVFLDQLLLLHDDGLEVDEARLARDADLVRFRGQRRRGRNERRAGGERRGETRKQCHLSPPADCLIKSESDSQARE